MLSPKRIVSLSLSVCLVASLSVSGAFAAAGTVNARGGLRLRNSAGTDAGILATIPNGTQLEIAGVTPEGWYQVTYNGVNGYVSNEYVAVSDADKATIGTVADPVYGRVTAGPLNVRSGAGTNFSRVSHLAAGTVLQIQEIQDGWCKIDGGYVSADYVQLISAAEALQIQQAAAAAAAAAARSASAPADSATTSASGAAVAAYAKQFLGCRYVHAGHSPSGFDCSGFTSYVFSHFGISISRAAASQGGYGKAVSVSALQPGDLLLFNHNTSSSKVDHVGIYLGGGKFIHASSPDTGVIISDISNKCRNLLGGRRLV